MVQPSILLRSSFLGCIIPQHFLVVNNFSIYFNHRQHSCSSCCLALSLFSHGPNVSWLQTFFLVVDILLHVIRDLLFTSFLCPISTSCDFYLMINKCFNLKQLPNVLQTDKKIKVQRVYYLSKAPRGNNIRPPCRNISFLYKDKDFIWFWAVCKNNVNTCASILVLLVVLQGTSCCPW